MEVTHVTSIKSNFFLISARISAFFSFFVCFTTNVWIFNNGTGAVDDRFSGAGGGGGLRLRETGWCSVFDKCTTSDLQWSTRRGSAGILQRQKQVCEGLTRSSLIFITHRLLCLLKLSSSFCFLVTATSSPTHCTFKCLSFCSHALT